MKKNFTYLKTLLAFLAFSSSAFAQAVGDYQSSGGGSGNWQDPLSWQTWNGSAWVAAGTAPNSSSGVITILNGNTITVASGSPITADQIVVASGGTLVVNAVLTVDDGTGTDLQVDGTLTQVSDVTGAGTVLINGTYNWNGGALSALTTIAATGTSNIGTASSKTLNTTLTNNGTIAWSGGTVTFNTGTLSNNATFTNSANTTMAFGSGTNAFNNNSGAIFTKSTATGTTAINIPFTNAGTINANTGTISSATANGSFTNTGNINFSSGATFNVAGTAANSAFNSGTTLTGTGTLGINANTDINFALDFPSTVVLNLSTNSVTLGGSGSLGINGTMNWTLGTLALPTTVNNTGALNISNTTAKPLSTTLTNNGSINWSAGSLNFSNGTLTNNSGATITNTASASNFMNNTAGTNQFTNSGSFTNTLGAATTTNIAVPFTNSGTITVNSGTLTKSATAFTNTGTIDLNGGNFTASSTASVTLDAGTTVTGTGGTLTLSSAAASTIVNTALSIPASITFVLASPAALTGSGSLSVNGPMTWSSNGGIAIPTTIAVGAVVDGTSNTKAVNADFTNNGTFNLNEVGMTLGNATYPAVTFTNNGTVTATITANHGVLSGGGAGAKNFANNGTITLNASPSTVTLSFTTVTVTNAGTFNGTGTYSFTTLTNNGTIAPGTLGSPAILTSTSNVISSTSTVEIEVVSSTTPGTGHDQLAISGTGATALNGTLTIVDNPASSPVGTYTILTTPGTFSGTFSTINMPSNFTYLGIVGGNTVQVQKTAQFPLPLKWGNFTAVVYNNNEVALDWTTFDEINTSYFVVEHSVDGNTFENVGTIQAKGNRSSSSNYHFVHSSPNLQTTNIYRIKQVDLDGKFTYSDSRAVKFGNSKVLFVQATPNPVHSVLNLNVRENVMVTLSDLNGQVLKRTVLQPGIHHMNVQDLPAGTYQLCFYQNQKQIGTQKIIKF